jgi:hypothetical protein
MTDDNNPINKIIDAKMRFKLAQLAAINKNREDTGKPPLSLKEYEENLNQKNLKSKTFNPENADNLSFRNEINRSMLSIKPEDLPDHIVKETGFNEDAGRYGPYDPENPPKWAPPIEKRKVDRKIYNLNPNRQKFIKNGDIVYGPVDVEKYSDISDKNKKALSDPFLHNKEAIEQMGYEIPENVLPMQKAKKFNDPFASVHQITEGKALKPSDVIEDRTTSMSEAKSRLENLKLNNASGKIDVGYEDFRTPSEKNIDSAVRILKPDNLKKMVMDSPKMAAKVLQYIAPPMAAYDLLWNKPRESAKEIQEKGLGQELAELGVDFAALGAPAARMAGKAALGATLDTAALPLGAYLLGKQFFSGNEPISDEEREKLAIEEEMASKMPGAKYAPIFAPEQDQPLAYDSEADKMYNYSKIKNLLKK